MLVVKSVEDNVAFGLHCGYTANLRLICGPRNLKEWARWDPFIAAFEKATFCINVYFVVFGNYSFHVFVE